VGMGENKVGLALAEVLSLHLLGIERIFVRATLVVRGEKEKRLSM